MKPLDDDIENVTENNPYEESLEEHQKRAVHFTDYPAPQFVLFHLPYLVNFLSQFCKFSIC